MNAKKRQRCLGALHRRKNDLEHWRKLEDGIPDETDQKKGFTEKRECAEKEVTILQSKLGVL